MPETSLDEMLSKIDYIFRITGMNLESAKKTPLKNKLYKLFYCFNFVCLNTDVAGGVIWMIQGVKAGENLSSVTAIAPCIAISFLGDLKSYFFVIYGHHINELLAILRELELIEKNRPNHTEKAKMIASEMNFLKMVLKLSNLFNWGSVIGFGIIPLILIAKKYITTKEVDLLVPFFVVYPFNEHDIKYWPFVYIKQLWTDALATLYTCGPDYFYFISCVQLRIQFQLLQHEFTHILQPRMSPADFHSRFVELVKWHLKLIHAVELIEIIYSKSTLFNFISSSALICLTGFNVTIIDKESVAPFLSFLFMSLLQIYFLCFFADMLAAASMDVGNAVYSCKWYNIDCKTAKLLHMVQIRTQKACTLSAFGFAEVNLKAFTKILSTAWSYFALLKTVYGSRS